MNDIKLKPIKPGMVIHCPTKEEAQELFKMLRELGYTWYFGDDLKHTHYEFHDKNTCYFIEKNLKITYSNIDYFKNNKFEIIEFSDLIESEVELQEAARPLVEYLRKNYHPHATAIVSLDYAEVLEGKEAAVYGEEV